LKRGIDQHGLVRDKFCRLLELGKSRTPACVQLISLFLVLATRLPDMCLEVFSGDMKDRYKWAVSTDAAQENIVRYADGSDERSRILIQSNGPKNCDPPSLAVSSTYSHQGRCENQAVLLTQPIHAYPNQRSLRPIL
jgi:hypothetical protein